MVTLRFTLLSPFGVGKATHTFHFRLIAKPVVDFLFVLILFSLSVTSEDKILYNFVAGGFHTTKLCSRLATKVTFRRKMVIFAFLSPFGGLRTA